VKRLHFFYFAGDLKEQHEKEKFEMEQNFSIRLAHIQEEFAKELKEAAEAMKKQHKQELGM
jgi:hypothetical protein